MTKKEQGQQAELKGQDLLLDLERECMKKEIAEFKVGDTVRVGVKIHEGDKTRTQAFEGICIARKGSGVREVFTVRRIVQGEGVERIFPLHSPNLVSIKTVRRAKPRRAKLHYLRYRTGRAAKTVR